MFLPEEFASLESLAEKWCVSDDADRSEIMDSASMEELQELIDRVSPNFAAINAYLDKNSDDEPAWNLGALAEAACEAQLDIERRKA